MQLLLLSPLLPLTLLLLNYNNNNNNNNNNTTGKTNTIIRASFVIKPAC